MVSLEFSICTVALIIQQNEYQEYFLAGKGAQGWQPYHLHVLIVIKSRSLILLETSGPFQACTGVALPLLTGSCGHPCQTHLCTIALPDVANFHCIIPAVSFIKFPTFFCSLSLFLSTLALVIHVVPCVWGPCQE